MPRKHLPRGSVSETRTPERPTTISVASSGSSGAGAGFSLTPLKKSVYKRIHTLLEEKDYYETDVLCFRLPKKIKIIYTLMSRQEKRVFKELLLAVLENYALNVFQANKNINVNINMNIVNTQATSVSETKAAILEIKEFLTKLIDPGPYLAPPPSWVKNRAKELLKKMG